MPPVIDLNQTDEGRRLAYSRLLYGGGVTPNQRSYFGNTFDDFYRRFGAASLNNPQLKWTDFLDQNPFSQQWGQMAPSQRPGGGMSQFAPQSRWVR